MQTVEWIKCSDENYWSEEPGVVTIVKIEGSVYTRDSCPYGWNILVRNEAEMMNIKI